MCAIQPDLYYQVCFHELYLSVTRMLSGDVVGVNKKTKTYNRRDSLVVTHPTTNLPACGLSTAERTGSPVFHTLWSYVTDFKILRDLKIARI